MHNMVTLITASVVCLFHFWYNKERKETSRKPRPHHEILLFIFIKPLLFMALTLTLVVRYLADWYIYICLCVAAKQRDHNFGTNFPINFIVLLLVDFSFSFELFVVAAVILCWCCWFFLFWMIRTERRVTLLRRDLLDRSNASI